MRRLTWMLCGAMLIFASPLAAQHAQTRDGFWIGFGLGAGSLGFGGDVDGVDREAGLSGYFRVGGTISPQFLLGAETNGWVKNTDGVTVQAGTLSMVGYVYPSVTSGLFLKAGLGYLLIEDDQDLSASGLSGQLGLGYDFRVGRNFSLTPFANYITSTGAELAVGGTGVDADINPNILQFGLGLTWH